MTSNKSLVGTFDYTPFVEAEGLGTATQVFGKDLRGILKELNDVLAA